MTVQKFRKRPVVIEAVQLTWDAWSDVCELIGSFPSGMQGVALDDAGNVDDNPSDRFHRIGLRIPTLEGVMIGVQGDWIIKGVQGEFYPCKPDIFEATYEAVSA